MNISGTLRISDNAKGEIARDLVALGGLPFYLLILVRASIGGYISFLSHVAIALPALYLLSRAFKGSNLHIARALILVVFTSIFYDALPFTIFSTLVWCGMIYALVRLNKSPGEILKGIALGAVSVVISYALTLLLFPVK
ncbi:MAG TPA: hypothetical protein VJV40_10280 [Thermodesulfobacteriota bacterium]|nr:hypothetical protein [Thermodesulfobacteriota bacterium]